MASHGSATQFAEQPLKGRSGMRSDWRFLLPAPADGRFRHFVLLGGSEEQASELQATGFADEVRCDLPSAAIADGVARLSTAKQGMKEVFAALRPGAVLYWEVDRRLAGMRTLSPSRLTQVMSRLNVGVGNVFWIAPSVERPRRYLPLDWPAMVEWYLSTCFTAGTPQMRLLKGLTSRLAHQGKHAFTSLVLCYSVTGVAHAEGYHDGRPALLKHTELRRLVRRRTDHLAVLTSGQDQGSRTVLLPLPYHGKAPEVVLKAAPRGEMATHTTREQETLEHLRARLSPRLRPTLPTPCGHFILDDLLVGIESYAPGCSLAVSSAEWGGAWASKLDDLEAATTWLIEFHRETLLDQVPWPAAWRAWFEETISTYVKRFTPSPAEQQLVKKLQQHALTLPGTLPIVIQHRDFGPWNICRAGERLTVIDWESGRGTMDERSGPALYDLLYFATHWNHLVEHLEDEAAEQRGFYDLWLAPGRQARSVVAARRAIARYMDALQIPPQALPFLLVGTWMERALEQSARDRVLGASETECPHQNRFASYISLIAQHAGRLFRAGASGGAA